MLILARENAILKWRELMGPTKVYKAQITHPDTIRGKFGLTDTRNATHGSGNLKLKLNQLHLFLHIIKFLSSVHRLSGIHQQRDEHIISGF